MSSKRRRPAPRDLQLEGPAPVQIEEHSDGEAAAVWMKISALTPWAGNPRKNEDAIPAIVQSIKRFGFGAPCVARKANGELIAGHTRYAAAVKLGLDLVPVRLLDISEEDAHRLALADNKLGEIAEWDEETLAGHLNAMPAEDLAEIGFTEKDLARMLGDGKIGSAEGGNAYQPIYQVLVECRDEEHQRQVLEQLVGLDIPCKALIA